MRDSKNISEVKVMRKIIEICNLNKSFGDVHAVKDLSFSVEEGELFAFLGVNGAGKSTTISIMCGQLQRDGGEVLIDGRSIDTDMEVVKGELGVVFQNSVLDRSLSVRDNLASRAALYGIYGKEFEKRLCELAELLDFKDLYKRTLGKLSGGQRRRIDIARAIIHKPRILILDEPTTGLDPQTRKLMWSVIDELRREQKMTVLLTTHYMEEAADADHVVIIDSGIVVAQGTPVELKNRYTGDFITLYGATKEEVTRLGLPYEEQRGAYRIAVTDTEAATRLIVSHPEIFKDYEIVKGKMDDVFLSVTGKRLTGGDDNA